MVVLGKEISREVISLVEPTKESGALEAGALEAYSLGEFACRTYLQAGFTCAVCMKACDEIVG